MFACPQLEALPFRTIRRLAFTQRSCGKSCRLWYLCFWHGQLLLAQSAVQAACRRQLHMCRSKAR